MFYYTMQGLVIIQAKPMVIYSQFQDIHSSENIYVLVQKSAKQLSRKVNQ